VCVFAYFMLNLLVLVFLVLVLVDTFFKSEYFFQLQFRD
jgi:hypothetical protein